MVVQPGGAVCVLVDPRGPALVALLRKGPLQILQRFSSKKLTLGSPTDANLVLDVQKIP